MSPHEQQPQVKATTSIQKKEEGSSSSSSTPVTVTPDSTTHDGSGKEELRATASMCHYCFDVLLKELKSRNRSKQQGSHHHRNFHTTTTNNITPPPSFVEHLPSETVECPLFVTWDKKKSTSSKKKRASSSCSDNTVFELRGCIGTLSPKPLISSIGEYALISALRDHRFDPVDVHELPSLRVAVSLLVNYEECRHCHDWTVGVHGIIIRFYASDAHESTAAVGRSGGGTTEYSATFLPEVAEQQGWDQTKTVSSLIRKSGYKGHVSQSLMQKIRCTRYQSSKHKVTFEEYYHTAAQQQLQLRNSTAGDDDDDDPTMSIQKFITTIHNGGGKDDDLDSDSPHNNCRVM